MPSKKGLEQAMTWLKSKVLEPGLDGINAEVCINVINDLREQNTRKGSIIHKLKQLTPEADPLNQPAHYKFFCYSCGTTWMETHPYPNHCPHCSAPPSDIKQLYRRRDPDR